MIIINILSITKYYYCIWFNTVLIYESVWFIFIFFMLQLKARTLPHFASRLTTSYVAINARYSSSLRQAQVTRFYNLKTRYSPHICLVVHDFIRFKHFFVNKVTLYCAHFIKMYKRNSWKEKKKMRYNSTYLPYYMHCKYSQFIHHILSNYNICINIFILIWYFDNFCFSILFYSNSHSGNNKHFWEANYL